MSPIAPGSVNAAFRSSKNNEAYIFINNEYILEDYAPGSSHDKILKGPLLISDGFPSLKGTPFGDHGIECAFDTDGTDAFIFSGELCALVDYAKPGDEYMMLESGPIYEMFPRLKGTAFEKRINAAFRSSLSNEAYIFTGDHYARINYASKKVIYTDAIKNVWHCLVGTIFESGIEAAFASHRTEEAYFFKGDQYARIKFTPGKNEDYDIIDKVKPIKPSWNALGDLLERKNSTKV
ncbi:albumin-2-like [Lotus japonicus]|uniref:albumin-2-like n=1 Tax=Lotus japonicus TaxID=34305 RepID=UPI002587A231|nr:albumin-2-like [Lotus japonicus]